MSRKILDISNDKLEELFSKTNDNFEEVYQKDSDQDSNLATRAKQSDLDTLKARVDNLVANPGGSTEGNTELIDIRTSATGKNYPTAGEAVRGQVSELRGDLDTLNEGGLILKEDFIDTQVNKWLDEHPEATTTVQDKSLELSKLTDNAKNAIVLKKSAEVYNDEMYGTGDDAVVFKATVDNEEARVMGFNNESDIANYSSRDNVLEYSCVKSKKCIIAEPVLFTTTSVKLSTPIFDLKTGTIIDAINNLDIKDGIQTNKYSGFVTETSDDGLTIFVSAWYKYKDTSSGQIPDTDRVVINPCTQIWLRNDVVRLTSDGYANVAVLDEVNLYNERYYNDPENYAHAIINGFDMIVNCGRCGVGYSIRPKDIDNTILNIGYYAKFANYGYVADESKLNAFQSNNSEGSGFVSNGDAVAFRTSNNHFMIDGEGRNKCNFDVIASKSGSNLNINPTEATTFLLTEGRTYNVPKAETYNNAHIKIVPMTDNVVLSFIDCRLSPKDGSDSVTTYECNKRESLNLISLNGFWYDIG